MPISAHGLSYTPTRDSSSTLIDHHWIKLTALITRNQMDADSASGCRERLRAPARPSLMALVASIIKARLDLREEKLLSSYAGESISEILLI